MPKNNKAPFSLFQRTTQTGTYWYIKIRDDVTGNYLNPVATGREVISGSPKERKELKSWVSSNLLKFHHKTQENREREGNKGRGLLFENYIKKYHWFEWENGKEPECIHTAKMIRKGKRIGLTHVKNQKAVVIHHLLPRWKGKQITQFTPDDIDSLLEELHHEGKSGKTLNNIHGVVSTLFTFAYEQNLIKTNPVNNSQRYGANSVRRGIFTTGEVMELLNPERIKELWGDDFRMYTANYLSAITGTRMGEIQGLQRKHVYDWGIRVTTSWNRDVGVKATKTDVTRDLPYLETFLYGSVYPMLQRVMELNSQPKPDDLVFYPLSVGPIVPLGNREILNSLYKAMERIGISKESRQERKIVFHSWRHYLNSIMRSAGIAPDIVRLYTGHASEQSAKGYTHVTREQSDVVNKAMGEYLRRVGE